jgi:citrate synthase
MVASTRIAGYDATSVTLRGKDLVSDLMGKVSFAELMLLQMTGAMPSKGQAAILDAVLVTIMEHGLVPSAIVSRLTLYGAPESTQGAIVAGLLGVGDRFAGTASECSKLLEKIARADVGGRAGVAQELVKEYRTLKKAIPGFGHPVHKDVDPRSAKLLEIVKAAGAKGDYVAALEALEQAVASVVGKRIVTNVSAAIAVALCEAGVPVKAQRGVVLTARCAGLAGHLLEESENPAGETMWNAVTEAVRYEP